MINLAEILEGTLKPDLHVEAEKQLSCLSNSSFPQYIELLANELSNQSNSTQIRQAAGIALKNAIRTKDPSLNKLLQERWQSTGQGLRKRIKEQLINALSDVDMVSALTAGRVIQVIAEIELSINEWPELLPSILEKTSQDSPKNVRNVALKTVGMVCETCSCPQLLEYSNSILTSVANAIACSTDDTSIQLAGLSAFYNSLEFVCGNFLVEDERNFLMSMACDATLSTSHEVMHLAYECLVKIITYYYQFMEPYMPALLSITLKGMQSGIDEVALQSIEFWSTLCEYEAGAMYDDGMPFTDSANKHNFNFSALAADKLIPALWPLIQRNSDDEDGDEWNTPAAAASCLSLIALAAKDVVVAPTATFIQNNIGSTDWTLRDAAIVALGSIVCGPGPEYLKDIVIGSLNHIFNSLNNGNSILKDTSSWTLGRILESLPFLISQEILIPLVESVLKSLNEGPKVSANSTWCLMCLADCFDSSPDAPTSLLSKFFEPCVSRLMFVGSHLILNPNIRASAFEAISTFILKAPNDCKDMIAKILITVIEEITAIVSNSSSIKSKDEQECHSDYLGNLCAVLSSIIRRLGQEMVPMLPKIIQILLYIFENQESYSIIKEELFLVVSAITTIISDKDAQYLEPFYPHVIACLHNYQDYQSYIVAIGVVGDICRALEEKMLPMCDELMSILVQTLQAPDFNKVARSFVLSVFGDIAMAIGSNFSLYSSTVMEVINQHNQCLIVDFNTQAEDFESLKITAESIIDAYTGIIQGLKAEGIAPITIEQFNQIISFITNILERTFNDPKILANIIGLIGDLADALPSSGNSYREAFDQPWLKELLKPNSVYQLDKPDAARIVTWAREKVSKHSQII